MCETHRHDAKYHGKAPMTCATFQDVLILNMWDLCAGVMLHIFQGYWLGGRPSAAVPPESARKRAESARIRADSRESAAEVLPPSQ